MFDSDLRRDLSAKVSSRRTAKDESVFYRLNHFQIRRQNYAYVKLCAILKTAVDPMSVAECIARAMYPTAKSAPASAKDSDAKLPPVEGLAVPLVTIYAKPTVLRVIVATIRSPRYDGFRHTALLHNQGRHNIDFSCRPE